MIEQNELFTFVVLRDKKSLIRFFKGLSSCRILHRKYYEELESDGSLFLTEFWQKIEKFINVFTPCVIVSCRKKSLWKA